MFSDLLNIPDPRPSKAHPDHRARRKEIESQFPHFDAKELGLKAGVLALMLGIACYPRIEREKERLEEAVKGSVDKRRKRSEGGERERERRRGEHGGYEGRARRGSVGWERADYERRRGERGGEWEYPRDGYRGRLGSGIGRRR